MSHCRHAFSIFETIRAMRRETTTATKQAKIGNEMSLLVLAHYETKTQVKRHNVLANYR
jgi:acyl-[acyl carrier protein]--UDP-N-acetylglucosamine O-acyltransferase